MVVEASRQMITIGSQSNATGSDGVSTIGAATSVHNNRKAQKSAIKRRQTSQNKT